MSEERPQILLLYTGGTIGMIRDEESDALVPFDIEGLISAIPELSQLNCQIEVDSIDEPIDSSNITPDHWERLAARIEKGYQDFDGFVILHGSDTMAYTASALSFMLVGLTKPVILTGSQLPVGVPRSDARENLITAIEIAGHYTNGFATVPEVCIYFEYSLYRGNRAHKFNSENFEAFLSVNYPPLAEAGVSIRFDHAAIQQPWKEGHFKVQLGFDSRVTIVRLFPGFDPTLLTTIAASGKVKGLIIETFGAGNVPNNDAINSALSEVINQGIIVLNITQCKGGRVEMGRYQTSSYLRKLGVVSGRDMTMEAAVTKLMFLMAQHHDPDTLKKLLESPLRGEMS